MTQLTIDILSLNQGIVQATDEYPAVDVKDVTQSTVGSTKKFLIADLFTFILSAEGFLTIRATEAASTGPYAAVYNNGAGGVNATLTDNSGTFAPFVIDGVAGQVSSLTNPIPYLIKNQVNPAENGIYLLTQNGDNVSRPWILIRAFYFNSNSNIINGQLTMILDGITLQNTVWQLTAPPVVTVGISPLVWNLFTNAASFITLPLTPDKGGTGIVNPITSTLTLSGPVEFDGGFPVIFNFTGATNVIFPTTGTLATTSMIPTIPVPLNQGGTGAVLAANNGGIFYSTAATGAILAGTPTANQMLQSGVSSAPHWSTSTWPVTTSINRILYSSAANTVSEIISANNGVLVTGNTGIPSILPGPGFTGYILQSNAAGAPSWSTSSFPSVPGPLGSIIISDGTNWITSTSLWPNTVGTAGKLVRSDGTINTYSTATFADTYTASNLLYSNGANTVTGLATANDGVLVTSNTGVPSILAGPGTTGHVLQSNAAAAPSFSTATYPSVATSAGTILRADGTNWVASTSTFADTYAINTILYNATANTVSGLATANSAMLRTNSTGVPAWSASLTNGQVMIGSTGGTPAPATLTAGSGISIANGANSITISGTGSGIGWVEVSGVSQAMAADTGYVANNAGLVTFTLPTTAAFGTALNVIGKGAGGWKINVGTGQTIQVGSTATTITTGSVASTNRFDSIELICTTADTVWTTLGGPQGNLTIV